MGLNIELVQRKIVDVAYEFYETTTVCFIRAECGAIFVGEAHCFDINDYKIEMGKNAAYQDAYCNFLDAEAYYQKCVSKMLGDFQVMELPDPISGGVKE